MIPTLDVTLDFGNGTDPVQVGKLARDPGTRRPVFEWDRGFSARPLPVWPLQAKNPTGLLWSQRGLAVPGLFEDSLPDGWGKLLLDREIHQQGLGTMQADDLARLAFTGKHGMGALCYAPQQAPSQPHAPTLAWFEDLIPRVEGDASIDDLRQLRAATGGSQGARPKFVAQLHTDRQTWRDHRHAHAPEWTNVLVKARGSMDSPDAVSIECAYGAMMRLANIRTSPMFAMQGDKESFFVTHRFDRAEGRRLHMATVAGLLDAPLQHGSLDYTDLLTMVQALCRDHRAVEEMYRRMLFNARAHARDDHMRNHAFLMDDRGVWALAPAYDVTFETGPGGEHSTAIAGEGRRPGPTAFAQVADAFGIKKKRATDILDEVDAAIAQWPLLAEEHGVRQAKAKEIQGVFQTARTWA